MACQKGACQKGACKEWSAACAGVDGEERDVFRLGCQRFATTYYPGAGSWTWDIDEEQSVVQHSSGVEMSALSIRRGSDES